MNVLIFILFFLFLQVGCGRKQKNIFYFPKKEYVLKINRLFFPSVKGVKVEKIDGGNNIYWRSIQDDDLEIKNDVKFLGYNVYRLVRCYFVPKKPLNKKPIENTNFLDNQILKDEYLKKQEQHCYLVQAVFKIHDRIYQGPSSQIICVKN
ncbi:hypothetical protein KAT08_01365 [Candidatus Babeliales bacterium]|nr:hypothetical protein [Candidatus Babeliales bacterium]